MIVFPFVWINYVTYIFNFNVKSPFADASKSKMHKQGDNEKSDKKTEQKGGSHSAQRDDDRCHYSASSSFSRRDDNNDEVVILEINELNWCSNHRLITISFL